MSDPAKRDKTKASGDPAELRRRAEARLSGQQAKALANRTDADNLRQLHELEVHQIELEMQNEELRDARDKIEAGLEKYTDLYDFAPVGYLTLDHDGTIQEANLAIASLLGTARSVLVKQRFRFFVSPEDRSAFDGFLKHVLENGTGEECEVSLHVEGKLAVDVRMKANTFEPEQVFRMAITDITEHKRAESATAQLAAIVKFSRDAIIGKDLNSIVTSWNLGAENIFGYFASEMVGSSILRLIPSDRHYEEEQIMRRIMKGESVEHFETVRVAKDGRLLDMSVAVSPIRYATGRITGASSVARDITEHKRAEADRLILNKLESTGILAGGIAHDFNNLLTVILLNLELAQTVSYPGKELTDRLDTAKKTVLAARGLTAQFVTFAQGGMLVRKQASLFTVIQESVRLALSGGGVWSELSLAGDLWQAEVDEGQIGQAIRNIALNAREAMPAGGVVSVRAENAILRSKEQPSLSPGEYVHVSIADRGIGISSEVLPKIFDPYFSTKTRGDSKGMGLGLTICHAVVQKHQGAIAVESELGVGTTFHIYLPAARKVSGKKKASIPAVGARQGRRKVLVMDDEEGVRSVIGATLWEMGHEVELAENGQMAIDVYSKATSLGRHFDVVVLDLTVRGGMGGQETLQALLKIDPTVKAIAMSGYVEDPVILDPERHGFKGTLGKPFSAEQLKEILSRVIGVSPANKAGR